MSKNNGGGYQPGDRVSRQDPFTKEWRDGRVSEVKDLPNNNGKEVTVKDDKNGDTSNDWASSPRIKHK